MNKPQFRTGHLGVAMVIVLMLITLYMAFAFPFNFLQMKQTETTEIKAVIVIGLAGEESPSPEAYFVSETPPDNLNVVGYNQLTEVGKRRMYSLGRFLRLKYYHLLLNGNPHLLYARASDTNVHLESAQTLVSALNPPKDYWNWFLDGFELNNWQPIAVHTNEARYDDLLSPEHQNCRRLEQGLNGWKNSSKYQQLLNDFRHDLQTLRTNSGLEFEDDLDMLLQIESWLRVRKAYAPDMLPEWFSASMADRLNHIADVCAQSRYGIPEIQRLYVGRLLHEITTTINYKIREHKLAMAQIQAVEEASKQNPPGDDTGYEIVDLQQQQRPLINLSNLPSSSQSNGVNSQTGSNKPTVHSSLTVQSISSKPNYLSRFGGKVQDPNMLVYILDKQRFIALMSSLNIYTCQPQYGSALIIEVHFDPITLNYFIRLLTSSSDSPLVNSEPLRVNPSACGEEPECEPQQFEQNLRHLILDRDTWQEACNSYNQLPLIDPQEQFEKDVYKTTTKRVPITSTITTTTASPIITTITSTSTSTQATTINKVEDERLSEMDATTKTVAVVPDADPTTIKSTSRITTTLPNDKNSLINETTTNVYTTTMILTTLKPEHDKSELSDNNIDDNPRGITNEKRSKHKI